MLVIDFRLAPFGEEKAGKDTVESMLHPTLNGLHKEPLTPVYIHCATQPIVIITAKLDT